MPRIVDLGVTQYTWVPGVAAITTPSAPKLADITAASGVNISPWVVATTDINPTASDTVTEKGITDITNAVVPSIGNYDGTLVLFRSFASGAPDADDLFSTFSASGVTGWIIRRLGKAYDTALAVADIVDLFLIMTDNPQQSGGKADGYLKLTVPLLQQGQMYLGKAMVA